MQNKSIKKAIDLVKKTGDKMVVVDENDFACVMMSVGDYEDLLVAHSGVAGLTEDELLDKINREIAIWKSNQENEIIDDLTENRDFEDVGFIPERDDGFDEEDFIEDLDETFSVETSDYYVEPL